MKKYLKLATIIFVLYILSFIGWMNLTPGHFRASCDIPFGYYTLEQYRAVNQQLFDVVDCLDSLSIRFAGFLSSLDFKK